MTDIKLDLETPVFKDKEGKYSVVDHDPVVIQRKDLEEIEGIYSPWLLILPSGIILGFKTERSASFAQRFHRKQLGLDPWTGKPTGE